MPSGLFAIWVTRWHFCDWTCLQNMNITYYKIILVIFGLCWKKKHNTSSYLGGVGLPHGMSTFGDFQWVASAVHGWIPGVAIAQGATSIQFAPGTTRWYQQIPLRWTPRKATCVCIYKYIWYICIELHLHI
jgi:hypothetical protein